MRTAQGSEAKVVCGVGRLQKLDSTPGGRRTYPVRELQVGPRPTHEYVQASGPGATPHMSPHTFLARLCALCGVSRAEEPAP